MENPKLQTVQCAVFDLLVLCLFGFVAKRNGIDASGKKMHSDFNYFEIVWFGYALSN